MGDVVAQRGMWWLSWLKQLGDTRQRTQLSRVRILLLPQSPERGTLGLCPHKKGTKELCDEGNKTLQS
jgi:hypothetical protein